MDRDEIKSIIRSIRPQLADLGIEYVYLFGSRARGDATSSSDIDFLLRFMPGKKTFNSFMDAVDILESQFPCHVDVLTEESFSSERLSRIMKEALRYEIAA